MTTDSETISQKLLRQVNDFWLFSNLGNEAPYKVLAFDENDCEQVDNLCDAINELICHIYLSEDFDRPRCTSDHERSFGSLCQNHLETVLRLPDWQDGLMAGVPSRWKGRLELLPQVLQEFVGIARTCEKACPGKYRANLSNIGNKIFVPLKGGMDSFNYPPDDNPPPYPGHDTRSSFNLMDFCQTSFLTGQQYVYDLANSLWALTREAAGHDVDSFSQHLKYDNDDIVERPGPIHSAVSSALSTILSYLPWSSCNTTTLSRGTSDNPPEYSSIVENGTICDYGTVKSEDRNTGSSRSRRSSRQSGRVTTRR